MNEWFIGDTYEWPVEFDIQINGNNTGKKVVLHSYEEVDDYISKFIDWSWLIKAVHDLKEKGVLSISSEMH
jgi:hypothetical protein